MKRVTAPALMVVLTGFLLVACNSGGSSSSSTVTTGFAVPTEISAVPPSSSGSLKTALTVLNAAAADAGTDYTKATTLTFVEERTLEQFDIIEQVLTALGQTNYADSANINQGPYKAMVAWEEESNGIEVKKLEPWIVDSQMIVENGQDVNRVRVWISSVQDGQSEDIQGEFKIYESATQNADGSFADFGVWKLNVKFGTTGTDYFLAHATKESGVSIIKLHDRFPMDLNSVEEHKAILFKSATEGYGKVLFPDFESCTSWPCTPLPTSATYAYNSGYMAVQKGGGAVRHVNRTSNKQMTHRYGLFDATTGSDIKRTKTFGFPVNFTLSGTPMFGYYGAWQGRHQLWAGGPDTSIPPGTVVTRQDRGEGQTAETYTVSEAFTGTLVKRSTVSASVNDIANIPVETWINESYNLVYRTNTATWNNCKNPTWAPPPGGMTCETEEDFTSSLPSLAVSANDNRKFVNINRFDGQTNVNYVYLTSGTPGFYVADCMNGQCTAASPLQPYNPADGDQLWASVGGSIYIMYNGTSWVEKTLLSFDTRTWTPNFDDSADKTYVLPLNQELYINSKGANYIVKRTAASTYDVKVETQTVANPVNVASTTNPFLQSGTVFKTAWNPDNDSTFTFDTDSSGSTFLKLKYLTIGNNDRDVSGNPNTGVSVGGVVTRGIWGLMAYVNNAATGTQFNWDYPREGENWGKITYLKDSNNNYVLVSDPVRLTPVTIPNGAGDSKTLSLQFDGWMHGLPDMYEELRKNDFTMNSTIANKIINIPAGTQVIDAEDSTKSYLIKPLEVSVFLDVVTDTTGLTLPSLTAAENVDLSTIPAFSDPSLGTAPTVTGTKYTEGKLIQ